MQKERSKIVLAYERSLKRQLKFHNSWFDSRHELYVKLIDTPIDDDNFLLNLTKGQLADTDRHQIGLRKLIKEVEQW